MAESRNTQNLSYTFREESDFFEVGYKVLQSREDSGFLRCARVTHNGKTRLVYDISNYRTLESLAPGLRAQAFLTILKNLLDTVQEARGNGFLQCENIETAPDKIFVDSNNYRVSLVYLPLQTDAAPDSYARFERELKDSAALCAARCMDAGNPTLRRVCSELQGTCSLEGLQTLLLAPPEEPRAQPAPEAAPAPTVPTTELAAAAPAKKSAPPKAAPAPRQKNGKIGVKAAIIAGIQVLCGGGIALLLLLWGTHMPSLLVCAGIAAADLIASVLVGVLAFRQNAAPARPRGGEIHFQPAAEGGATELLEDIFVPNLMISGVNTPQRVELLVEKPNYTIGKSPESADGVLSFNKAISRLHCRIVFSDGGYFISDEGSANGTWLNGSRLAPGQRRALRPGDKLRLANSDFVVRAK